ncbi:MAG: hypothetical protein KZQ93_16185 [Candidatus Thiodiazotropha sp. (ex Monitilora ramsayi)]|nr:hypothetical protein [Candidatus Thiodiazotropha sp. (ex Monitilora ramsayi)]
MFNVYTLTRQGMIFYLAVLSIGLFETTMLMAYGGEQYKAQKLRLENLSARVDVVVADVPGISVNTGTGSLSDRLDIRQHEDSLLIRQKAQAGYGDISVITSGRGGDNRSILSINGRTTVIDGNSLVVMHNQPQQTQVLNITVPTGTPVELIDFRGRAIIEDTMASLHVQGGGRIEAGSISSARLDVGKNARINIDHVSRDIDINASGNSKVDLKSGDVRTLRADVTGNSKVKFGGHAVNVNLSVSDNARLFVASADRRESTRVHRNGRLTIGDWQQERQP